MKKISGQCEKNFNTVYSASKGNYRKLSCLWEHSTQETSPPWVNEQGNYRICLWITLIGGSAGRAGCRAVFPNEKREFSAGCTEDRRADRRAAEKGSPLACHFPQPSWMCSLPSRLNVQPTGPSCSAAHQPAKNSCFAFGNTTLQPARPADPPFSVILCL